MLLKVLKEVISFDEILTCYVEENKLLCYLSHRLKRRRGVQHNGQFLTNINPLYLCFLFLVFDLIFAFFLLFSLL